MGRCEAQEGDGQKTKWPVGPARWWGGGSSRSNRFGHANATPLSHFNQVLNTSIVAHLEYSHHAVSGQRSVYSSLSPPVRSVSFSVSPDRPFFLLLFDGRLARSPDFLPRTPPFVRGRGSALADAGKEEEEET